MNACSVSPWLVLVAIVTIACLVGLVLRLSSKPSEKHEILPAVTPEGLEKYR